MNDTIASQIGGVSPVKFLSLEDFFFRNEEITSMFTNKGMDTTSISGGYCRTMPKSSDVRMSNRKSYTSIEDRKCG